jgi:aldose 1-epimerase
MDDTATKQASVGYFVTAANELVITYDAKTDKPTIVNITNHTYWNLSGNCNTTIHDHRLTLNCAHYLPVDATQIPTGEVRNVSLDRLFDFTGEGKLLERSTNEVDGGNKPGLDHCFVVDVPPAGYTPSLRYLGQLAHARSGRVMNIYTTHPGVQVYTGNWLDGSFPHVVHNAICLETQHFPDAINHPHFPSVVLNPSEVYCHQSVYQFSVL